MTKTNSQSVRLFKLKKLQLVKIPLGEGLINSKIRFSNIGYEGELRMFGSNLFCSIIVEETNLFLKKLQLNFIKCTFLEFCV